MFEQLPPAQVVHGVQHPDSLCNNGDGEQLTVRESVDGRVVGVHVDGREVVDGEGDVLLGGDVVQEEGLDLLAEGEGVLVV